jgi:formylglycine-generating enzyme required for sulfatase activity
MRRRTALIIVALVPLLVACSLEPDPIIEGRDGAEMLLIPAGEFIMGGKPEDLTGQRAGYLNYEAERPLHRVSISTFYLDRFEVTNRQYRDFLEYVEKKGSSSVDHPDQPGGLGHFQQYLDDQLDDDDQPAVGLNWFDAYAYCNWAGKRLPTEAEWEYAARGGGEAYRKYPWGNKDPNAEGIWWANYSPKAGAGVDRHRFSAPVGSYPDGVSPFGVMDMAGNAEEWVHDWWSINYYRFTENAQDPQGPAAGRKNNRVIKGGSFGSNKYHIRIATRLYGPPEIKTQYQGARCAQGL